MSAKIRCAALCAAALWSAASAQASNAQPQNNDSPGLDFCKTGTIYVIKGKCGSLVHPEEISELACKETADIVYAALNELYPLAKISIASGMPVLTGTGTIGVAFIGEGDRRGGFYQPDKPPVYPDKALCPPDGIDFFGGFYSYSKYAPLSAAKSLAAEQPKTEISRTGAALIPGSWPDACKAGLSLVFDTATLARSLKSDAGKLLTELETEKKRHIKRSLPQICAMCDKLKSAVHPLAEICLPYVCAFGSMDQRQMRILRANYCTAISGKSPAAAMPAAADRNH